MKSNKVDRKTKSLSQKITDILKQVHIGERWVHYKNPNNTYIILEVGIIEKTEEVSIIYKSEYGDRLIWIRPYQEFLGKVKVNGNLINRFTRV